MWIYWRIVRLEVCQLEVTIPNTNTFRFHAARYISLNMHTSKNSTIVSDLDFTSSLRALFGMPSRPRGLRLLFYRRFLAAHFWILELEGVAPFLLEEYPWIIFSKRVGHVIRRDARPLVIPSNSIVVPPTGLCSPSNRVS